MSGSEEFNDIEALQSALTAEHAAVYGYGYIGAQLSGDARTRAYESLDAHRARRDTLRGLLTARGADPAPAKSSYDLPEDADAVKDFAVRLEHTTAQTYLELAASGEEALRAVAARALQEATVGALRWGGGLPEFPGFPDGGP